jgi:hypothetical protein
MDTDLRVTCTACANLRSGHCLTPKAALLSSRYGKAEIGPALAQLPQHCPGFARARIFTTTRTT